MTTFLRFPARSHCQNQRRSTNILCLLYFFMFEAAQRHNSRAGATPIESTQREEINIFSKLLIKKAQSVNLLHLFSRNRLCYIGL